MDAATPRQQSTVLSTLPRRRGPPPSLRIDTPSHNPAVAIVQSESSAFSAVSSAVSDADSFILPSPSKSRSLRNMKKLSITLPSAQSSTKSFQLPEPQPPQSKRRPSIISLPNATKPVLRRNREDEGDVDSVPYSDGPIQVLPGIWLGSEDTARNWKVLVERGIRSILNVAKEVYTDFDTDTDPLRPFMSTPDLNSTLSGPDSTYYPAHVPSGRPSMHYLKLPWSHGQSDLVHEGFPAAMSFIDGALEREDGVLIHCQCGVSRSATLVIAVVMRAAALRSPSVPPEVWTLKGMQGAYAYVKEKSSAAGPNMSLIYQLLDYERALERGNSSPACSEGSTSEEEWGRQRLRMGDGNVESNKESVQVMYEARALDRAMEDRIVARKSSASSLVSSIAGVGSSSKTRFAPRKRTGSTASVATSGSVLSESLVEENEEEELLGVGGSFDGKSLETSCSSAEPTEDESPQISRLPEQPLTARQVPVPPSAPAHKSTFALPPNPMTSIRSSFDLPLHLRPRLKPRRRPPPLGILPPVPSSPVVPVNPSCQANTEPRSESQKLDIPPLTVRHAHRSRNTSRVRPVSVLSTPSQTLFVFPPSPTLTTRTPSTMTLTSNASYPFPTMSTPRPRVSTSKADGRRRSYIGVPPPATPTTASSRVDARGWIGLN
ncbi:predicted protein [Sparassis crispa]|uniref:protein-tyrosine-phosphatase n=1 Tax=Sparassis crispa TaxID=139825 RepID=A0A401G7Z1_9APHY|nr:predicted protein [Sparassis crispa]GBE78263.1 predicted protein [Sparassis crispa]